MLHLLIERESSYDSQGAGFETQRFVSERTMHSPRRGRAPNGPTALAVTRRAGIVLLRFKEGRTHIFRCPIMRVLERTLLVLALLISVGACGGGSRSRPSGDPDVILRHQVLAGSYATAHDVVRAIHPNWLVKRSPSGRNNANTNPIWVFVDGSRYGDLSWLHNVPAQTVGSIRRIDGISATTRWGTGYSEGVLYITTFSSGPSGTTEN